MKKFICIACPVGCNLEVKKEKEEIIVKGNQCKRGQIFGQNEYTNPVRMLTTTVKAINGSINRVPVISSKEVPKDKLLELIKEIYKTEVKCPIKRGDVIIKNIKDTGVDIISTRSVQ